MRRFPKFRPSWRDEALAAKWEKIRRIRAVVTGALEIERAQKRIGSSLEAAPQVFIADESLCARRSTASISPRSASPRTFPSSPAKGRPDAFRLAEVPGVAVVPRRAEGRKCARSWRISPLVGADPDYPDVTPRDAEALRELKSAGLWP